jgi:hypothetical protein
MARCLVAVPSPKTRTLGSVRISAAMAASMASVMVMTVMGTGPSGVDMSGEVAQCRHGAGFGEGGGIGDPVGDACLERGEGLRLGQMTGGAKARLQQRDRVAALPGGQFGGVST